MMNSDNNNRRAVIMLLALVATTLCFVTVVESGVMKSPEFAEPLKNVTLTQGADVEFSCDVRHLGTYRVTWSFKKDDVQKFLAIGIVKITHNPRVHISRFQKSDDVTQFNLYVYNLKKGDDGQYFCSVNSNPMIEQIGTLDVIADPPSAEDVAQHTPTNDKIFSGKNIEKLLIEAESNTDFDTTTPSDNVNSTLMELTSENNSSSITQSEDSATVLCIDLGEIWENARERMSEFLSTLMKFTYSYWFS